MKYRLGDFTLQNWNDWGRVPRDPVTIGTAIITGLGGSTALAAGSAIFGLTTVGALVGYLATTAITSWAMAALAPKPDFSSFGSQGTLVNAREAAAPAQFVYGEVRKGGVVTFYESTGDENKYLHQIIVLAAHEVQSIDDLYINDQIATWNSGTGLISTAGSGDDEVEWGGKIRVRKHLGDQTTADSDLVSETSVDSTFVGNGIAYLYVRYEYDQDIFANGVPLITAKVRGKKVYDPVSGSTFYSNNAALCIRDYITSVYGLNDTAIDDVSFAAAAHESDEPVDLADDEGTEKRYTLNGIVSASTATGDVLGQMVTACAGTLFWGSGYWKLKVGAYSAPVKTFTLDDLRGPINLETRISMRDNFNAVRGTFNDAAQGYITADYPEIVSQAFKTEDGGEEVALDLPLPFTTSAATAQRLAKLTLFRGREQMTINADFGLEAFSVEVGDIIEFDNDRYGFDGKEFEVVGWRFASDQEAGDLRVNLTLRETSEAAFNWNAEETEIISNNTTLPAFTSVDAPTNLTLTSTATINNDGITIPAIKAVWDISPNAFVQYYEIQYKRLGGEEDYGSIAVAQDESDDWGSITVAATSTEDYGLTNEPILTPDAEFASVFGSSNSFTIEPVLNGYDYQVRVRAVSAIGVRSPFVTASLASQGDTTPPNEPLSLSAVGGSKYITVSWINPADQDLSYVEVWENETNNLATATLIGTSSSTNFMRPNLANNTTRYYWARAVDYSLNRSAFTSSVNATTLLITPNDFNDAVNDLFQEAGAFGIEPVQTLPASGDFDGQLVLLLPDITIYRWDETASEWSTDIFTASSVETGSITYTSFASGIEPVGVVDTLPTVSGYEGPSVVVLTTDGKLYRLVSGAWTAAVNTDDINGTIGENLFSDDLRPIERVATLPTTGLTQGRVVMLTSDNKLYRYTGNAWTSAVPATDLTGQVNGTQIADSAITATKIGNDAVTTAKIAVGAITSTELGVNAVTSAKIANSAITAAKIGSNAVTTAKIANNAITSSLIDAGAITETKIASGAITTPKIAAGAITASEIAAGSITSSEIAANTISAGNIAAGAVTASEIASGAITTGKLAAGAVTANEIAADAITTDKISANAVTAAEITSGAITTAKLAAGAVTAAEISAGAVTTGKLAAGAVTANEIAANAITSGKIAANTITAADIAANAITASELSAGSVSADKIAANSVNASKIAADAVTADKVAANAITAGSIAANAVTAGTVAAGAINTDQLAANAITSAKIFTGAITADKVATDAITANKIAASSIITSKIAAGAVTANKITVSELSAISASLGTILVDTANIANAAITNAKIDDLAVNSAKISNAAITTAKIGNLQVDTLKIKDQAVSNTGADSSGLTTITTIDVVDGYTTIASVALSTGGGQTIVNVAGQFSFGGVGQGSTHGGAWRILKGATVLAAGNLTGVENGLVDFSGLALTTSAAGTTTITLQCTKTGVGGNNTVQVSGTLVTTELKK